MGRAAAQSKPGRERGRNGQGTTLFLPISTGSCRWETWKKRRKGKLVIAKVPGCTELLPTRCRAPCWTARSWAWRVTGQPDLFSVCINVPRFYSQLPTKGFGLKQARNTWGEQAAGGQVGEDRANFQDLPGKSRKRLTCDFGHCLPTPASKTVDSHPLPGPFQDQQRLKQKPRVTTKGPTGDYGLSYPSTFPEGTNGQASPTKPRFSKRIKAGSALQRKDGEFLLRSPRWEAVKGQVAWATGFSLATL